MFRLPRWVAALAACWPLLSQEANRVFPLDSVAGLRAVDVEMEASSYLGRKAVHIVAPNHIENDAMAILPVTLRDGTVELDVAGKPKAGASDNARGFIGVAFHLADKEHFEYIYLRPVNSRVEDQLRRNHSVQYASMPNYPAIRLRNDSSGQYESYVDLETGAWTKMRVVIQGAKARLYVNGSEQPCLIVNDLKLGASGGALALWVGEGTDGYFSNLRVTPAQPSLDWQTAVDQAARELNFHGAVIVQAGGKVVVNKAFGAGDQANPATRYWIASVSKSFTATLIFKLRELSALALSDKLARFFPNAPDDKKQITLEQLLIHTSGFPNQYTAEGIVDRDEAVKRLLDLPLKQPPGSGFFYTNDEYSLLASIAEVAGKAPFGELLNRYILIPAEMKNSALWPRCTGSLPVLPLSVTLPDAMNRENWGYKGPDGICSNVSDLLQFMNALLAGKILERASLDAMWEAKVTLKELQATAGWFRAKTAAGAVLVRTTGTDHGHNSIVNYYPDKDAIVVSLSSSQNPDGPLLARMLAARLEELLRL